LILPISELKQPGGWIRLSIEFEKQLIYFLNDLLFWNRCDQGS
jgi:hypothetical protein